MKSCYMTLFTSTFFSTAPLIIVFDKRFVSTAADLWALSYSYVHNFHLLLGKKHAAVNPYHDSDALALTLVERGTYLSVHLLRMI